MAVTVHDRWLQLHQDNPSDQTSWRTDLADRLFAPPEALGTDDHRSGISTDIDFAAIEVLKMEKWCREVADERLAAQGLVVDDRSRRKLAIAVGAAVQRASLSLARLAILACDKAGIAVTLPKPMTSGLEARGRFGKQDFVYLSDEDAYRCPAGEKLIYHYTNEEDGQQLRRYWTNACRDCALKASCTTGKERRITRWEHEHVLEEVQRRLDNNPLAMRQRRETVEHPFGTMKARMGATHFLTKTLPKVAAEMALSVLAYNLTRVMNIVGIKPLIAAIVA